ncbi:MAG: heme-binding protein [Planctomycetaceae bacterium]|nr:heme-binding protein [Planctomycetaceae bacterium]
MRYASALTFVISYVACTAFVDAGEVFTQTPSIAASQVKPDESPRTEAVAPHAPILAKGPTPDWIWGADTNKQYRLSKTFNAQAKGAWLKASCDNRVTIFINGKRVASSDSWEQPVEVDVLKHLARGKNEIVAEVANAGGPSGFVCKLATVDRGGTASYVVSDKSWKAAEKSEPDELAAVKTLSKLGGGPWGDVFANKSGLVAKDRDVFNVLPGFQVELLYTVPKETLGSWVSITFDNKGRLIASDQGDQGLCRITPPPIGSAGETKVERLDAKMSSAHGMLYAFDSLYVSANGGPGSGLYRLKDTNGDDQYDEVMKLKGINGGGEHGPHALRLSPDGESIYWIAGNHTDPPAKVDHSTVPSNWGEDLLLPRQWDARGHARGKLAPGGWIAKTDPDGKHWEIVSIGYRNSYDMDFNADGELFAYDADMEWDFGTPWYRPTRVVHAPSGSEFGWRSGTGKWPTYYVDSLPPLVDIGPGSPVGVTFGYGTKFPAKYQKSLYICDWTFGTMYAIHPTAAGASYTATKEEFVSRTPLPLTDNAVGPDGALYFTVGGRGAQSELYRVTYVGDESTSPTEAADSNFADLRKLRRQLETWHRSANKPEATIQTVWQHLDHPDRHIRYAARVALEHQDAKSWQQRVLNEDSPQKLITAAIAFARQGDPGLQNDLLDALNKIDYAKLDESQRLQLLRVWQLIFVRMGQPDQVTATGLAKRLDEFYPAETDALNRELVSLLVYLNSATVTTKSLALIEEPSHQAIGEITDLLARNAGYGGTVANVLKNQVDLQKLHYAFALRNMKFGWTLEQRQQYFTWLASAREKSGGASYQGFIDNIRNEALANASEAERKALESTVATAPPRPAELPKPKGPGYDWTLEELEQLTKSNLRGRNYENGRKMFAATKCVVCHRFAGEGGATGPDLTNVAGRFSFKDLSEATVDPSKVISDQYRAHVIVTTKGQIYSGRIASEQDGNLTVLTDPEDITKVVEIAKDEVDEVTPSKVSLMPKDLLKTLNEQEVLDLLAYLQSRGNPNDAMFAK